MRFLALAIILSAGLFAQGPRTAAALLTALEGEVTIVRLPSADSSAAQILAELYPGDRLRTGAEASATLLYRDGKIVAVNKNSSVDIPDLGPDSLRSGRPAGEALSVLDQPGRLVALIAEGEKVAANLAVRGIEDSLVLTVSGPGNTALLSGMPGFSWGRYPGAQVYRVKVQRMGGDIWSAITVDTVLQYPENKPELEPGAYLVRFYASNDRNETLGTTDRAIKVLSPEQADSITASVARILGQKPDPFTRHLLCAKIYESRNLRLEAIKEYEALLQIKPDLPFIHRSLSILYRENGQVAPANRHYDLWQKLAPPVK